MEKIIDQQTDRNFGVTVTRTELFPGWPDHPIHLTDGKETITLGMYDVFPIIRMLAKSYELSRKEEDRCLAPEALPVEA